MYAVSAFAEDILYGSDKPGIVVRKRAVRTHCAASYLSDKQVFLDMIRARVCRSGLRSEDIHRSLATWRAGEHWRLLDGDYDCDISLKRAYEVAEAIGLRKAAFEVEDPDPVNAADPSQNSPAAAVPAR